MPGRIRTADPVNRRHPLNQGRVAWWPALPATMGGPTWYDLCGPRHATLANFPGPAWSATTRPGGSGQINYPTGYFASPPALSSVAAGGLGPYAVALWVRFAGTSSIAPTLGGWVGGNPAGGTWSVTTSNIVGWVVGYSNTTIAPATPLSSGAWHQVLVTRSSSGLVTLFYDGIQVATGTDPQYGPTVSTFNLPGGTRSETAFAFDDVAIWSANPLAQANPAAFARLAYEESRQGYPHALNRARPPLTLLGGSAPAAASASPATVAPGSTVGTPGASPGAVAASPATVAPGSSVGQPSASPGAVAAGPATIPPGSWVGQPAASPGAVAATPATISPGSSVGTPAAGPGASAATPGTIAPGSSAGQPSAAPGPVSASPATIPAGSSVGTPSALAAAPGSATASPGTIPAGSSVGTPGAAPGFFAAGPSTIPAGSSVGTPSASAPSPPQATAGPASIGPGSSVGTPTATRGPAPGGNPGDSAWPYWWAFRRRRGPDLPIDLAAAVALVLDRSLVQAAKPAANWAGIGPAPARVGDPRRRLGLPYVEIRTFEEDLDWDAEWPDVAPLDRRGEMPVHCYAGDIAEAARLMKLVRAALKGQDLRSMDGLPTYVRASTLARPELDPDPAPGGGDCWMGVVSIRFIISSLEG